MRLRQHHESKSPKAAEWLADICKLRELITPALPAAKATNSGNETLQAAAAIFLWRLSKN
ncbi:hypothetical protein ACLK1T_17370 [Escherichia coli]